MNDQELKILFGCIGFILFFGGLMGLLMQSISETDSNLSEETIYKNSLEEFEDDNFTI